MQTRWTSINFAAINAACLQRLPALLAEWLPGGRAINGEWVALNPTRADRHPGSFRINTRTGKWADFATDDRGGDPISLYAYLHGMGQSEAAKALSQRLGVMA